MTEHAGAVRRQLEYLLNGHDFYSRRERLEADDRLVRERAAQSLGMAIRHLREVEGRYRERYLPPPSREHPRPDPDRLAAARRLASFTRRIGDAESLIRAAPYPHTDRTWERLRSSEALLELVLALDLDLIRAADKVLEAAEALDVDGVGGEPEAAVEAALGRLEAAFRARQAELTTGV